MTEATRAGAMVGVATADAATTGIPRGLPPELLAQSVRRLRVLTLVASVAYAFSLTAHTTMYFLIDLPMPIVPLVARGIGLVVSLGFWLILRSDALGLVQKCRLGLVFEIIGAAVIASSEPIALDALGLPFGVLSIVAVWILVFNLIVPSPPRLALLAALASAAMVPLAALVLDGAGAVAIPLNVSTSMTLSTFVITILAWLASRGLYDLGRAVTKARELGSYQLVEPLGAGGMGEVWRATHRMLKRPAAIKLIRADTGGTLTPEQRQTQLHRFEREALATASLESKHTIQLFDFGATRDGAFYYVMELLKGFDLETLVRKHGPLPPERVVFLLQQVLHSLGDAHGQRMIHRDIKPANIFVCRLGPDHDFVKVLDFGLVKEQKPASRTSPGLTNEGVPVGTPSYMPPEIALSTAPPSPQTDLYMVGCVAYWLLTGSVVFEGDSAIAVISQHIAVPATPPSQRTELGIPPALEELVMECLAKDPSERPASAAAMSERLAALELDGRWDAEAAQAWWDTHHPVED